nr:MAG TPA: hypothetical protein [Bacteriophage sp.]
MGSRIVVKIVVKPKTKGVFCKDSNNFIVNEM